MARKALTVRAHNSDEMIMSLLSARAQKQASRTKMIDSYEFDESLTVIYLL